MDNSGAANPNQMDTSLQSDFAYPLRDIVDFEDLRTNYRLLINAATSLENSLNQFSKPDADFNLSTWSDNMEATCLALSVIFNKITKGQTDFGNYIKDNHLVAQKILAFGHPTKRHDVNKITGQHIESESDVLNSDLIGKKKDGSDETHNKNKENEQDIESDRGVANSVWTNEEQEPSDSDSETHNETSDSDSEILNSFDVSVSTTSLSTSDFEYVEDLFEESPPPPPAPAPTPKWRLRERCHRPGFYSKKTSSTKRGRGRGRGKGQTGRGVLIKNTAKKFNWAEDLRSRQEYWDWQKKRKEEDMGEKLRRQKEIELLKAQALDELLDEKYVMKKHDKFEEMKQKKIDNQRKKQKSKEKREENERTRKGKDIDVQENERTSSFMYDADNEVEPTSTRELVRGDKERESDKPDKKIKIGLNGFGKVGALYAKAILKRGDLDIVAINDPCCNSDNIKKLLPGSKNISVFGSWKPDKIPWGTVGVDVVIESSGTFTDFKNAPLHLQHGVKKVFISSPRKDAPMFLMEVNGRLYTSQLNKGDETIMKVINQNLEHLNSEELGKQAVQSFRVPVLLT